MPDEQPLHPNLADAVDGTEPDVAELEAVARLLADLPSLEAPPLDLFDKIAGAAFAAPSDAPSVVTSAPSLDHGGDPERTLPPEVIPLARRQRRWAVLAAVAAAVVVAVGLGAALLMGGRSDDTRQQVVALEALPGFEGVDGEATVVHADGDRRVELDLSDVELPPGSHLELWLLDPAVEQTISLGVVTPGATFAVPSDVDLSATPIIDISVEPADGDPAHSGVSVVRGEIDPA